MTDPAGRPRIVVVGSTMIDLVAYADRLPGDGETVVGRTLEWGFGGKGANQAVAAARFGADVAIVNAVGDDDYGTATLANFEAQGVRTDYVTRAHGASGVAPIWVDASGTNRIIVVPGANAETRADLAVAAIGTLRPAVVVGQFEIPQHVTAAGFAAARAHGAVTVLNPAPATGIAPDLLAATDWLVPNETEFGVLSGEPLADEATAIALHRIADYAGRLGVSVVVTLGEHGAVLAPRGERAVAIAAPGVAAIDTTGAGDAFVGAFAVGLALGWSPEAACRLGCAAGSDSTTRAGTQRSYADRDRAAALLAAVTGSLPARTAE